MRKLILLAALALSLTACGGCAGPTPTPGPPVVTQSAAEQAQDVATKTVLSMGEVLITAPALLKAARQADKMTKVQYNASVDIYNQALASYTLLNQALQAAITAGKDPTSVSSYSLAMLRFTSDRNLLNNIVTALGGA